MGVRLILRYGGINMHRSSKGIDNNKSKAVLLIFLGWLVYTTSYLGKVNYSANITQIMDFYNINKTQAGIVPTFFFFSYGIGQVFNGIFCRKYNIKWMVFVSLFVSASINLTIAVTSDFMIMKWLWLINGFTLSVLWPTLIRLFSETLPKKVLGFSSVVMGTTVAIGTLTIYGLSSLYAVFDKFKLAFYTAGSVVMVVAFIWVFFYNKAVSASQNEKDSENDAESIAVNEKTQVEHTHRDSADKIHFLMMVYALCFCAVGVNLIKDGLTTWVPSILKDEFSMSDSLSILLTLLLPVVAVFGNAAALKTHKLIPDYVSHCATVFAVIAVLICAIIGSLSLKIIFFTLAGLVVVNFLISSLNSLITGIFPLFMRGKINSGLFAGVLNGFCYLGSALSSYGLGVIADNFGWTSVFLTLIGFCVAACIMWLGYTYAKKILSRKLNN